MDLQKRLIETELENQPRNKEEPNQSSGTLRVMIKHHIWL